MSHAPVMLTEVLEALEPRDGGVYVDGTFGAGGYSRGILGRADCKVIAFDRDPSVSKHGDLLAEAFPGRFQLFIAPFSAMDELLTRAGSQGVDGVALDLGVSSMQIDQAERGFSFRFDGPLDMRMSDEGPTAADVVAELDARALTAIFRAYGEEKKARRAAEAIKREQAQAPITTTGRLADIVRDAVGKNPKSKIDPATRVFQALRIYVNDELGELLAGLQAAERILNPAGRLAVVSFHSLEDRIVKRFLRNRSGGDARVSRHAPMPDADGPAPSFNLLYRGAEEAGERETDENPRARSAKLRAAIRTDAPAWEADDSAFLPRAPRVFELGDAS